MCYFPVLEFAAMLKQCSSRFEREARKCGWQRIAGLDEVGRGSLFGPVVAAAVILDPKRRIVGLDDSKKLPAERREILALRIREHALAWAIAEVDARRIDAWNIYQASRQAMSQALSQPENFSRITCWIGCHATGCPHRAEIADSRGRTFGLDRGSLDHRES